MPEGEFDWSEPPSVAARNYETQRQHLEKITDMLVTTLTKLESIGADVTSPGCWLPDEVKTWWADRKASEKYHNNFMDWMRQTTAEEKAARISAAAKLTESERRVCGLRE